DLVIVTLPGDALRDRLALAHDTHKRGIVSLHGHLEGIDAVAGPVVIPGETACWNCTRLRRLAHAPAETYELHTTLLAQGTERRERAYLAPAAGLLGNLLALEALKLLTGYAPSQLAGHQLVQSLVTLDSTLHGIVRVPWCEVCGDAPFNAGGSLESLEPLRL